MTKLRAFAALQDLFGKEQAQTLADFIESQEGPDLTHLATKNDISTLKDEIQLLRQDMKDLEIRLVKDMAKTREDMITRMNWNTIIQIVALLGGLAALAKII